MLPQPPRARPPFASPTCNLSGPLGWGRGPDSMSSGAETYVFALSVLNASRAVGSERLIPGRFKAAPPARRLALTVPDPRKNREPDYTETDPQRQAALRVGVSIVISLLRSGAFFFRAGSSSAPEAKPSGSFRLSAREDRIPSCEYACERRAVLPAHGIGRVSFCAEFSRDRRNRPGLGVPKPVVPCAAAMPNGLGLVGSTEADTAAQVSDCRNLALGDLAGLSEVKQSDRAVIHRGDPPGVAQRIPQRRGVPVDNCPIRLPGNPRPRMQWAFPGVSSLIIGLNNPPPDIGKYSLCSVLGFSCNPRAQYTPRHAPDALPWSVLRVIPERLYLQGQSSRPGVTAFTGTLFARSVDSSVSSHPLTTGRAPFPSARPEFSRSPRRHPGLGMPKPVVPDAFTAARLSLPLIEVEVWP